VSPHRWQGSFSAAQKAQSDPASGAGLRETIMRKAQKFDIVLR
jgi:hypothetical protein